MWLKKIFCLLLVCITVNAQAFDAVKLDKTVSDFLQGWFADKCSDIRYSFLFALSVDEAYKKGFYAEGIKPSDFKPPSLPNDIYLNVKTDICDYGIEGYAMTLRETTEGYQVIGYSTFNQPE